MTSENARELFKKKFIGPAELKAIGTPFLFSDIEAPEIPFVDHVLEAASKTHILIFTPKTDVSGTSITLNYLREIFGMDPAVSEPCMYNQDWYVKEEFAATTVLDGSWHLIRKSVLEEVRAKRPDEIEAGLESHESFPNAVTCAFTFFAWWLHTGGEKLWDNDFLWCSDRDHNDDRIYVGRYTDLSGINKNGFNIHRHLALRPSYSAAPELTQ